MSPSFDAEAAEDPIALFGEWFRAASESEVNDPNAMSLATATAGGRPSVRIVLLKRVDEAGFAFYTNVESRKGVELLANPQAALCFHWKSLRRQVRVEGTVSGRVYRASPAAPLIAAIPEDVRSLLRSGLFRQA